MPVVRLPDPALLFPPPTSVVARVLPHGVPALRDRFLARTGMGSSALDPDATPGDPGLFGPDSVTWDVVGQPAQMLAGLRAALLQSLAAPIPTATHSTGAFYKDFMGRVARTGVFVTQQNLGSMDEVHASARKVRAMHRVVKGTWQDGVEFDASDPHLQAWVSMTLTDSMLVTTERFGTGRLSRAKADQFVREQSTHGALLDPRVDLGAIFADPEQRGALRRGELDLPLIDEGELPTTRRDLRDRMHAWTSELRVTDLTRQLIDGTVQLTELDSRRRSILRPFVLATLSTVPDEWHDLLAPGQNRVEEFVAAQAIQGPFALLYALMAPSPSLERARARVAAGA